MAIINAASASLTDVQTAVTSASDGDTVKIPNGSATWTDGVNISSKQIKIEATNITETSGGDTSRNVTITNNSSNKLFNFVTGSSYHCGLAGLRINEGTGTNNAVEASGSGSKVMLMHDMYFEVKERTGDAAEVAVCDFSCGGGVVWNCHWEGIGTGGTGGIGPINASFLVKNQPRVWNTAATMGTADTNGTINLYIEDSSWSNLGQFPDGDDHARIVIRYNDIDGAFGETHGFSSTWGGRHIEWYNNEFSVTEHDRNHIGRYIWIRGGTMVLTDNIVNNASFPGEYGAPVLLMIGENSPPGGGYPLARQPGYGHNGSSDVSDPIYMWNNTGARFDTTAYQTGWDTMVQEGRDIFIEAGAKSGYTKYAYPHPLRTAAGGGTPNRIKRITVFG